jgi:membrane protein implicated in regulation of membrane protease activity
MGDKFFTKYLLISCIGAFIIGCLSAFLGLSTPVCLIVVVVWSILVLLAEAQDKKTHDEANKE